ncbi:MAG: hypothetical protein V7767_05530, partial [Leeuwenhoekiella sp.]
MHISLLPSATFSTNQNSIEHLLNVKTFDSSFYQLIKSDEANGCNTYEQKYFFKKLGLFDMVLIHHFYDEMKVIYTYYNKNNSRPVSSIKHFLIQLQKLYGTDEHNLHRFRSDDLAEISDKKFTWIGRKWLNVNENV